MFLPQADVRTKASTFSSPSLELKLFWALSSSYGFYNLDLTLVSFEVAMYFNFLVCFIIFRISMSLL